MAAEITRQRDALGGRFAVTDGGAEQGYLTYVLQDGVMVIEHTVVAPRFQGQGIAGRLVEETARYAREEGLKVRPLCSYAARVMSRDPKFQDLLA